MCMKRKQSMDRINLTVPAALKREMQMYDEVNWSAVATKSFEKYLRNEGALRPFEESGAREDGSLADLQEQIISILKRRGVLHAAIFGSVAKGRANTSSDIDILVELKEGSTLLDLATLKVELQDLLGREVDVLTYRSVDPLLKEQVLKERVPIL